MKKFVAILSKKRAGHLNASLLNAHVEHLKALSASGSLFLCGPLQDNNAALLIVVANSKEQAQSMMDADPFVKESYYEEYSLSELIEANESNNWLADHDQTNRNLCAN